MNSLLLEETAEEKEYAELDFKDKHSEGWYEVPDFDPFEAGKLVAQETSILEIHIGTPGFKKSINSAHFMKVLGSLTEEQIADLSPEMRQTIEDFQAGRFAVAVNNDESADQKDKLDPSMIRVSQDLIDKKAIAAIAKHDKRFTNWIKAHTVPSPIKFQGAYLMRLSEVNLIDSTVLEYHSVRKMLVNQMGERWNAIVADAKTKRGPFFDPSDYPDFASVRARYQVEARWLSFNVPAALEQINVEIYKREGEKARLFFADAAQEARDAVRVAFQGMIDHLLSQLGNDESGKPKRFMGGSLKKITDFIEVFMGGGDLTGDDQMKKICNMAKDLLSGVDAAEVRKQEGLRASLETAVKAIQHEASKMVVVGRRKFALGDDEETGGPLSLNGVEANEEALTQVEEHLSGQTLKLALKLAGDQSPD